MKRQYRVVKYVHVSCPRTQPSDPGQGSNLDFGNLLISGFANRSDIFLVLTSFGGGGNYFQNFVELNCRFVFISLGLTQKLA